MRDRVLLVPDKNTEYTVRGALGRHQALGIRHIDYHILVEPGRDGGVRRRGKQVLSALPARFSHALLLLDYEECGSDAAPADLEAEMDNALSANWGNRAKTIVIEPEVDVWMWGAETHLRSMMNWRFSEPIRSWLESVFRNREVDFWSPIQFSPAEIAQRGSHFLQVAARMAPGVPIERASARGS